MNASRAHGTPALYARRGGPPLACSSTSSLIRSYKIAFTMSHPLKSGTKVERRAFLKMLSLAAVSGLTLGARRAFAVDPDLALVPQPPGPPKPPAATPYTPPVNQPTPIDPPYAHEIPSIAFDAPPGSWTLVVMPDTQDMAEPPLPAEYTRQSEWIVAHREKHNIVFVAHEGDLVNENRDPAQWVAAQAAMRVLTDNGIPYCLLPGNHDLMDGPAGSNDFRSTALNSYFTADDYRHSEAFGLFEPGKMENSWHEFTAPTGKYLLLALEFGVRNAVVDWADQIVTARPDRKVIVVVHSHLYCDNTRYNKKDKGLTQVYNPYSYSIARSGDVNDGEDLWDKLLKKHRNIYLVLCGHEIIKGSGYLASKGDYGQRVHQILANYQAAVAPGRPYFGGGYLRLMQFHPDNSTIVVKTYSPWLDQWLTTPDQQFTVTI